MNGAVDEVRAVIEWAQHHAGRQLGLDHVQLFADSAGNEAAVLPREHDGRADQRLRTIYRGRAGARVAADLDSGDIADEQGLHPTGEFQGDSGEVCRGGGTAVHADDDLLASDLDEAAARIACALLQVSDECRQRHARIAQAFCVRLHHILLFITAAGVHLRNAGRLPQQRLHDGLMHEPQFHELVAPGHGLVLRIWCVIQCVIKDFPQPGGHGREAWGEVRR